MPRPHNFSSPMLSTSDETQSTTQYPIPQITQTDDEPCTAFSALTFLPQEKVCEAVELDVSSKTNKKPGRKAPNSKFIKEINKLFREKDFSAALHHCKEQLSRTPSNAEIHYYYGLTLKKLGQHIEADAEFKAALKLMSPYPAAFEARQETKNFIKNLSSDPIISRRHFLTDIEVSIPTHYEYLQMSLLVYGDKNSITLSLDKGELNGWELDITAAEINCSEHDYFAVAFFNRTTRYLVIAHRGSDFSLKGVWAADYQLVKEQLPKQFEMAQKFLAKVKARYPGYIITHTGHSLGAGLAELSAYHDDSVAITADSPGIKPILMLLRRDQSTEELELGAHIITYVSLPNIVNTLNEHIGEVRAIFPARPSVSSAKAMAIGEVLADTFGHLLHFFDQDREELNLIKAGLRHSLPGILAAMDEHTGYPKAYRLVKNWPHGEGRLLAYENFCMRIFHNKEPMQDPEASLAEGSAEQRELRAIGYHTVSSNHQKMGLARFTQRSRDFLKRYLEKGWYPSNINLHVLTLYEIENDVVIIKPHSEIFTVMDFKDYIELKLFEESSQQLRWKRHIFYQPIKLAKEKVNPYKEHLLSVPTIQSFSAEDMQQLLHYLDQKESYPSKKREIEALEKFILARVDKKKIESELNGIKKSYNSLRTVCSQIFKDQGDDSILRYLSNNFDFYLNKRLVLLDHKIIINANIEKVYSQKNSLFFMLADGSGLRLEFNEDQEIQNVFFTRRQQYTFFKQLTDFFSEKAIIEIKPLKNPRSEAYIQPGRYVLTRADKRRQLKIEEIDSESCNLKNLLDEKKKVQVRKKMHSQSWRLESVAEESSSYTIRLVDCGDLYHIDKIVILVNNQPYQNYTYDEFQQYENYHVTTQLIEGMDHQGAQKIKIRSKIIDENQIKIKKLNEIEELRIAIINFLKEPRNIGLLNKLLDSLQEGKLAATSDLLSLFSEKEYQLLDLQTQLNKIHKLYQEINTSLGFGDILTSITLDTNYLKLIGNKDDSVVVFKAMQLLQEAFGYIRKLKAHELIMFWGKTGAGKSTALNYFGGVPLKFASNKYGQPTVEVDAERLPLNAPVATIGHSLTTSNTTYVQGYKIIRDLLDDSMDTEPFMLCDTPGFDDTRGESYELAAMLSIQQAIRSAKAIRSIILVVPYESFLLDRANPVIDLLGALQARVPDIFNTQGSSGELSRSFFLLVTKHASHENACETFEEMLIEFRDEEHKKLSGLLKPESSFEREIVMRKITMWNTLLALGRSHIHFIDIENLDERMEVLKEYMDTPAIPPKKFANPLDSEYLQSVLMQYVHSSVYTWRESIMLQYLKKIPMEIAETQSEIQQKQDKTDYLLKQNQMLTAEISQLDAKIAALQIRKQALQQAKENPDQITDGKLRHELEEASSRLRDELVEEKNKTLKKLHEELSQQERELTNKEEKIKEITDNINSFTDQKRKLEIDRLELSSGSQLIPLGGQDYRSVAEIKICNAVGDAHQKAVRELRNLTNDECINERTVTTASYTGVLHHVEVISKDYYIVPKDPKQQEEFLQTRQVTNAHYRAEIEGEHYEPYLASHASPDANKIAYSFRTIWKGDSPLPWYAIFKTSPAPVRPWFSIAHRLPNAERNAQAIKIKDDEINEVVDQIDKKKSKRNTLESERDNVKRVIASKEDAQERIRDEIIRIKEQAVHKTIDTMINQCVQMIADYEREIFAKHESITSNKNNIGVLDAAIRKELSLLEELKIKKLHFAIIIKTQFKILILLRQLSELVISNEFKEDSRKQAEGLYFQCQAYITYFDLHINDLINECQKDLNMACVGAEELQLLQEMQGCSLKPKATGSHFLANAYEVDELGNPISVLTQAHQLAEDKEQQKDRGESPFYELIDEPGDQLILDQLATLESSSSADRVELAVTDLSPSVVIELFQANSRNYCVSMATSNTFFAQPDLSSPQEIAISTPHFSTLPEVVTTNSLEIGEILCINTPVALHCEQTVRGLLPPVLLNTQCMVEATPEYIATFCQETLDDESLHLTLDAKKLSSENSPGLVNIAAQAGAISFAQTVTEDTLEAGLLAIGTSPKSARVAKEAAGYAFYAAVTVATEGWNIYRLLPAVVKASTGGIAAWACRKAGLSERTTDIVRVSLPLVCNSVLFGPVEAAVSVASTVAGGYAGRQIVPMAKKFIFGM